MDVGGKYVVKISDYGSLDFRSVVVRADDKNFCSFPSIPSGSTQVCIIDVNEDIVPFEVSGFLENKRVSYSDICRRVVVKAPGGI